MKNLKALSILTILTLLMGAFALSNFSSTSVLAGAPILGPSDVPKYGGTMIIALSEDPSHLDPGITTNPAITVVTSEIYVGLTYVDRNWTANPCLAKDFHVSDDGFKWVFNLNENATWSDGQPVTSADVVFSWYNVLSQYHARAKYIWQFIQSVEAVGPYTVLFTLNTPIPYFPIVQGVYFAPILPKHIFAGTDIKTNPYGTGAKLPIGCGPYIMTEWVKGDHLTLQKNPNYWFTDPVRGYKLPYLDKVIFKVMPTLPASYLALQQGEVDYLTTDAVSVSDMPTIKAQNNYYYLPKTGPLDQTQIIFNMRTAPLNNTLVRQALYYAINCSMILDLAYWNQGTVLTGPFGAQAYGYTNQYHAPAFNVTKANELLDQAGYPRDSGTGTRFTLARGWPYNPEQTQWAKAFQVVQQLWKAVGVEVVAKTGDAATVAAAISDPNGWDVYIDEFSTFPDPSPGMERFYGSWNVGTDIGSNLGAYNNTQDDALWIKARTEMNDTLRKADFAGIQQILTNDVPRIWVYESETDTVWSKDFVNTCQTFSPGAALQTQLFWWTKGQAPPAPTETVPKGQYDSLQSNYTNLQGNYTDLQSRYNDLQNTGAQVIPTWIWAVIGVLVIVMVAEAYLVFRKRKP